MYLLTMLARLLRPAARYMAEAP